MSQYCQAMPLSRRGLLGAGVSFFAWTHLPKVASAAGTRDPRFLTVILRGALDGLSAVAPVADPDYAALRAGIALSKEGANAAIPLDGFFALHPKMPNFARAYAAKQALVVHATASPYRERSHFDGQDVLETGLGGVGRVDSGWLNRVLMALPKGERIARSGGLGVGTVTPLILRGEANVLGWAPQASAEAPEDLARRVLDLYQHRDPVLAKALAGGIKADQLAKGGAPMQQGGGNPAMMARAATGAARLMMKEDGPRIGVLSYDGWDTHANQGGVTGRLADLLDGLDRAFAAFEREFAETWTNTVVLVVTEFGRTANINGTEGSDHGTATVAMMIGGAVKGGRVVADWPGLKAANLHEGRDLKPTTDLRGVMKGILADHLGLSQGVLADRIFPGSAGVKPIADLIA
ncbi:MAG: DUF1501 domain-containing protein [Beijerinckiaceae bacterium]|jgi:uncharacterized protein (DUF1501 family)|nr:DUF1501 domain-containing protein [Beijerinckiaceae bacterium]